MSRKATQGESLPAKASASQGKAADAFDAAEVAVSGVETDIDAENRAALQNMSPAEVETMHLYPTFDRCERCELLCLEASGSTTVQIHVQIKAKNFQTGVALTACRCVVQVEAAKKEIEDRLGPEKVAFLRMRAAHRAKQATQNSKAQQDQPKDTGGLTPSLKASASQGTWTPPNNAPAEVPRSSGKH